MHEINHLLTVCTLQNILRGLVVIIKEVRLKIPSWGQNLRHFAAAEKLNHMTKSLLLCVAQGHSMSSAYAW